MLKQGPRYYLFFFVSLFLYVFIAWGIQRHETLLLLGSYFLTFCIYIAIVNSNQDPSFWFVASIIFRVVLLFSIPNLSDDFYRFIWDGRLMASGYHPFAEIPSYYIDRQIAIPGITGELYHQLNSKEYFTVYPPIAQFIFWLSAKLSPHSIYGGLLFMKTVNVGCDIGSIFLIRKILLHFNLSGKNVLLYALNPLVIIELSGNLHLESIMIFFMLCSITFLIRQQVRQSAVAFGLGVGSKLLPLIFLPLMIRHLGLTRAMAYCSIVGIVLILIFLPLYNPEIVDGFSGSLGYYFKKFEFNASIYYIVRAWGFWYYGYNIIQSAGWKLGAIATLLILAFSVLRSPSSSNYAEKNLFLMMMGCLLIFLLFTTTLHPWYITTLVAFSVFTNYRYPIVWAALIFMTYAGYNESGFSENLWIVAVEYALVAGYLVYEVIPGRNNRDKKILKV